jgi:hypothetical protein
MKMKKLKLVNCDFCKTRHDQNPHADFDIAPYPGLGVILIKDRYEGNRSVIDDINYVLYSIQEIIPDLTQYKIIHPDSTGTYVGIKHDNGRFISFYPIQETDFKKAVKLAKY